MKRKFHANEFDRNLGSLIKRSRQERGMTQRDVGRILGVSYQQIMKYESGVNRLSAHQLIALVDALEIDPSDVLSPRHVEAINRAEAKRAREVKEIVSVLLRASERGNDYMAALLTFARLLESLAEPQSSSRA